MTETLERTEDMCVQVCGVVWVWGCGRQCQCGQVPCSVCGEKGVQCMCMVVQW